MGTVSNDQGTSTFVDQEQHVMVQNSLAIFWGVAGFAAGIAVAFFGIRLWLAGERRWAIATSASMLGVCLALYMWMGNREALQSSATTAGNATAPHAIDDTAAGSMDDAVNKLAARLAQGNGTDADWELLAQTYEFLGDRAAAQLARQHELKDTPTGSRAASPAGLKELQQRVAVNPADTSAWLAIAQLQREARQFEAARTALEKLIELRAMTADTWADYADVVATLRSLSEPAVRNALDAALKLNPGHAKALWLRASAAHAEQRFADAVKDWRQLLAALPPGSPDAAIIEANLAEDARMSGNAASASSANAARIIGMVELDPAIRAQVSSNMTLFVFAKAEDSPAPVAAYRTRVDKWPVQFILDDTSAMMPSRKLSMYPRVTLQARLSRSGQATAASGDLQSDALATTTTDGTAATLKIRHVVP